MESHIRTSFLAEIWHPSIAECVYQQSAFFAGGLEVPWDGLSLCWRLEIYGQSWWFAPHDDGCCHRRGCWRKPQPGWHQYNTQLGCRKSLGNNSHTFYSLGNQVIGEHVRMLIPSFFLGVGSSSKKSMSERPVRADGAISRIAPTQPWRRRAQRFGCEEKGLDGFWPIPVCVYGTYYV